MLGHEVVELSLFHLVYLDKFRSEPTSLNWAYRSDLR